MRSKDTKKYLSHEERYETMKKALVSTFARTLKTNIVSIAASVVLLAFASASTYSFYAAFIVGIIIDTINTSIISGQVWLLFEGRRDVRSRKFKAKKKSKRFDAVEEQTFIGIND
jgi:preprotein translocase subunit SecF